MKKTLAIVLVFLMVVSLLACNQGTTTPSSTPTPSTAPSTASSTDTSSPSVAPTTNPNGGEIGMYDPNYDYTKNPKYRVQYVVLATGGLYEAMNIAFEHWASKMNIEYLGMKEFGGDKDAFLSNLPTLAKEVDGLLVDPDAMQYTRVAEILNENGTPWMGVMAPPRDYEAEGAPLVHPFVGFDHYQIGTLFPEQLLKYKEKAWPDVPLDKFGFITIDYSVSPPLHAREQGCKDALAKIAPDLLNRYYVADTAIKTFDVDTSSQVVSTILSQHPDIEYWLIFAEVESMAQGAAAAIDTMGLTDNTCIADFGAVAVQVQWDADQQDAWRIAGYLSQTMFGEPMIGALYAFMSGQATPDNIWPNWVNINDKGGENKNYASRLVPFFWIEYDSYKSIMKWSDVYAGSNYYPDYPADGITRDTYSSTVEVPATYKVAK